MTEESREVRSAAVSFLPGLRELGSYYSSQHLAHVGYLLVVAALVFQVVLQFFGRDSLLNPLTFSAPTALALLLIILLLFASFYFLARTQLYSVYSQAVWDLQGIQKSDIKDAVLVAIDKEKASLFDLVQVVTFIRLLASKEEWTGYFEEYGSNYPFWAEEGLVRLKSVLKKHSFRRELCFASRSRGCFPLLWVSSEWKWDLIQSLGYG